MFEVLDELLIETTLNKRGTVTFKHNLNQKNVFTYLHTYALAYLHKYDNILSSKL